MIPRMKASVSFSCHFVEHIVTLFKYGYSILLDFILRPNWVKDNIFRHPVFTTLFVYWRRHFFHVFLVGPGHVLIAAYDERTCSQLRDVCIACHFQWVDMDWLGDVFTWGVSNVSCFPSWHSQPLLFIISDLVSLWWWGSCIETTV